MTVSEMCKDQLQMVQLFAKGGEYRNALDVIYNFRSMGLKPNADVNKALGLMAKAEKMLKARM